jgi:hypothetical protein
MYYQEPDWSVPHLFRYIYTDRFNAYQEKSEDYLPREGGTWVIENKETGDKISLPGNEFWERFEMAPEEEKVEIPKDVWDAFLKVRRFLG